MPKWYNKSNKSCEQDDQFKMSDAPLHTSLMQTLKDVIALNSIPSVQLCSFKNELLKCSTLGILHFDTKIS